MSKGNRTRQRKAGLLPEAVKCRAHKKNGEPCQAYAMHGQQVCGKHGGKAAQNLRKAKERLTSNADALMKELLRIALSAESEAVRLAAVRDALDRIGIGTKKEVDVTLDARWLQAIPGLLIGDDDDDVVDAEVIYDRINDDDDWQPGPPSPRDEEVERLPSLMEDPPRYPRGNRLR